VSESKDNKASERFLIHLGGFFILYMHWRANHERLVRDITV